MGDPTDRTWSLSRRRLLIRGSGIVGAATVTGATARTGVGQTTDEPESGGTLRMALDERPPGLDPLADEPPGDALAQLVFGGLYAYDDATGLVAYLAAGEPQIGDERREYVVELRENARFQNGDPVTAGDVRYSVEAARDRDGSDGRLATVLDAVEAVDDRTVRFRLPEAYAPFPHLLTTHVVPESVREDDPEAFRTQPVGAGPFAVPGRLPDESLRLERWDDYWANPRPRLEAAEFAVVEAPTDRINALAGDEIDVIAAVPPSLYPDIADRSDAEIADVARMDYVHVAFNCRAGPTANPAVREAVDLCVSMDEFVAEYVEPAGTRTYSPVPPPLAADWELPVEEWNAISNDRDVAAATERLESADVPADWTATILVPDEEIYEQLGVAIANGLREAGYGATVEPLDPGPFHERRVTGDPEDYDMYVDRWTALPDPDAFTYPLFATAAEGQTNGTYYREESVQAKLETARRAVRQPERRDLYADAITTILEDRAHLPAFVGRHSFGVGDAVRDFDAHPVTAFRLVSGYNNVAIGKR